MSRFQFLFALLLIFSAFLIFYNLGNNSLHTGDESRYATVAREMLHSDNWITPTFHNQPYFNKPPLKFWLTALLFHIFGISEWTARFWSAVAALGCVAMTTLFAKELFGEVAGLWSGFALTTSVQFLYEHCAKTGEMDPIILFFLVTSFYLLIKSEQHPERISREDAKTQRNANQNNYFARLRDLASLRGSYLLASFAVMGLSSLTKNFAGFIPFGLALFYLVVTGKWRLYSWKQLAGAVMIFLVLSFSWILVMMAIHGKVFLQEFLIDQSYDRIVSEQYKSGIAGARSLTGGFWFIAQTMFNGSYPWTILVLPALIWTLVRGIRSRKDPRILPILWFVVMFIAMLFFKNKMYWYVLPLYIPACIIVGFFLSDQTRPAWLKVLTVFLILLAAMIFIQANSYGPFFTQAMVSKVAVLDVSSNWKLLFFATLILTGLWFLLLRAKNHLALFAVTLLLIVHSALFAAYPLQYSNYHAGIHELSEKLTNIHPPGLKTKLILWDMPSMYNVHLMKPNLVADWYLTNIPLTRVVYTERVPRRLEPFLVPDPARLFVMPLTTFRHLKRRFPAKLLYLQYINGVMYSVVAP